MSKVTNKKSVNIKKRSTKKAPPVGIAHVRSTYNNTTVTISNLQGDVLTKSSGGVFQKGARKATSHAAEEAGRQAAARAHDMGLTQVTVILKGPGSGRESSIRGIYSAGIKVLKIIEATPIPHNGCRRKKKKRV